MFRMVIFAFVIILTLAGSSHGQVPPDYEIGPINIPTTAWGYQKIIIPLKSNTLDYSYVVARVEIEFPGSQNALKRTARKSFVVAPQSTDEYEVTLYIPGSYDSGQVDLALFSVVDSLDQLLPSQQFHHQLFSIVNREPEALHSLITTDLLVPPFVDRAELFDNIVTRAALLLMHRDKTLPEIATLTGADSAFLNDMVIRLSGRNYIHKVGGNWRPNFAVVDEAAVLKLRPLVDQTVDKLVQIITANLPRYDTLIADMMAAGTLSRDKNDLLDGGAILHHPFPVVLALVLWDKLGREFINDGFAFNLFQNSDMCDAHMGEFMYMVAGTDSDAGRSFYYRLPDPTGDRIFTSAGEILIYCNPRTPAVPGRKTSYDWSISESHPPTYYSYDKKKVEEAVTLLAGKGMEAATALKDSVTVQFTGTADGFFMQGGRYWAWNLVVSRVIEKLLENNVLKQGSGGNFYMLNEVFE